MTVMTAAAHENNPDFIIRGAYMAFDLDEKTMRSTLDIVRYGSHDRPLVLEGNALKDTKVTLSGRNLSEKTDFLIDEGFLIIPTASREFSVVTSVSLQTDESEYGVWMVPEDFRSITWFLNNQNRPVPLVVKMISDSSRPILRSNGVLLDKGILPEGRHYAYWHNEAPEAPFDFFMVAANSDQIQKACAAFSDDETKNTLRKILGPCHPENIAPVVKASAPSP